MAQLRTDGSSLDRRFVAGKATLERLHPAAHLEFGSSNPATSPTSPVSRFFLAELQFGDRVLTDPAERRVVAWLVGQRLADAVDDIVSLGLGEREQLGFHLRQKRRFLRE